MIAWHGVWFAKDHCFRDRQGVLESSFDFIGGAGISTVRNGKVFDFRRSALGADWVGGVLGMDRGVFFHEMLGFSFECV